ncbi:uncharacterized protein LOC108468751 [Gossypium arboreum]|nr:uncharacterized protein LOC108468751 [Gossypium arboreum]
MLNLAKFLKYDIPTIKEGEGDEVIAFIAVEAWKHFDFLCQNYILNGLSDAVYEGYSIKKTTKKLWISLDHKYKIEDASAKKFLVAKFLNFVMIDFKLVVNQEQELQLIIHEIIAEGMVISESFQVAAIFEKLSPAWNDFKHYLKHKRWHFQKAKKTSRREKQPQNGSKLGPKGGISNKKKIQGKCFNCNKMGHKSSDCRIPKKVRANEANVMKEISKEMSDMDLCA